MTEFEVLKNNLALLVRTGFYSYHSDRPFSALRSYYFLGMAFLFCGLASAAYVFVHRENLEEIAQPAAISLGGSTCFCFILLVGLKLKTMKRLNAKLQRIVDGDKDDPDVIKIYLKTENKCLKYTNRIHRYIYMNVLSLVPVFQSIRDISSGHYDTSAWSLSYKMILPFNQESLLGWFLSYLIQTNVTIAYSLSMTSISSYYVACCCYISGICEHFEHIMETVGKDVELNLYEKDRFEYKRRVLKIKENLCKGIDMHFTMYDVFNMVADIISGAIFTLLPQDVVYTALSLYNMEYSDFDITLFGINMVCCACGLLWPSILAYFGTIVTDRVEATGFTAYGSNWYYYPAELRNYIKLIMIRAKKPAFFTGYHLFACTVEVRGRLFKTSCSYYWMFRSLAHR